MAMHKDRTSDECLIAHNRSKEERRAEVEEIITKYTMQARDAEALTLQQIRNLTDVERLGAYQNSQLAAIIKSCRENQRLDAYFAVMIIIYAMSDLRKRVCCLSAAQIGNVLSRTERTIRNILARLIADGYIIKGDHPIGRYRIVPHYPAIIKALAETGKVNPTWIMNGFAPGTIGRQAEPKLEDASTPWPDPCTTVHGVGADPCTVATSTPELKRQSPLNYSSHRVAIGNNNREVALDSETIASSPSARPSPESQIDLEDAIQDQDQRADDGPEAPELEPVVGGIIEPGLGKGKSERMLKSKSNVAPGKKPTGSCTLEACFADIEPAIMEMAKRVAAEKGGDGAGWTAEYTMSRLEHFRLHHKAHKRVLDPSGWITMAESWLINPHFAPSQRDRPSDRLPGSGFRGSNGRRYYA